MGNTIKTYTTESGKKIEIHYSTGDSRSWDNLTKMICFHNRYSLGDEHDYNHNDYSGWDEMKNAIVKNEDAAIIKPLYLYDHSGITIATSPFSCRWDSGQVGFVIVTKKAIRDRWDIKKVTKKYLEKAEKVLEEEVETYDSEIRGDVYGFNIKDKDGNYIDSCVGFYGNNFVESGMIDYVEDEECAEFLRNEKSLF